MNVAKGPIIIEKSGNPAAVMISYEEFIRLNELENMILLSKAVEAAKDGFLNEAESLDWFNEMNKKAGSIPE